MDDELAAAHHEAGHCIAVLWAFTAPWLPLPAPPLPVRYIEIIDHGSGRWGGTCAALNVYSPRFGIARDLMERQITIHLAGGIAEAIYRGERRRSQVLRYAMDHCAMDTDLQRERALLFDLRQATGLDLTEQGFADLTLTLLLEHWSAVEALAEALVEERRIEGHQVERIIGAA